MLDAVRKKSLKKVRGIGALLEDKWSSRVSTSRKQLSGMNDRVWE